jgi:hypothetical protein
MQLKILYGINRFLESIYISMQTLARETSNKVNLVTWDIITSEAHFCVPGCGGVESVQHLFLSYNTFGSHWSLVRSWIDFLLVDSQNLSDHFLPFIYSFMQLIWLIYVWVVWNKRNHRLFRNLEKSLQKKKYTNIYTIYWN